MAFVTNMRYDHGQVLFWWLVFFLFHKNWGRDKGTRTQVNNSIFKILIYEYTYVMEDQTNWSKKNENSLVGGQGPDPLPRIWVCVHKVSIVCGNMWDSPQGFPPIPPLHSSTAGEWVGGETMWSPLRPAPAAPSCRPAEQNFIDYFTGRRTTLQPHWSTARPKQTTTEVPSPSGGSSSTWKSDTKIYT